MFEVGLTMSLLRKRREEEGLVDERLIRARTILLDSRTILLVSQKKFLETVKESITLPAKPMMFIN